MHRITLSLLPLLLAPALIAQEAFTLRVSPQVNLADGEKMVVPIELTNTGTVPLAFGASSANAKWGLNGVSVPPGQSVGFPLSTFRVSANASATIPPGHLFRTGPSFGLHLPGSMFVHVNCNPPSNSPLYIVIPVAFASAASAAAPTLALPGSVLEPPRSPQAPGTISWGVSWVPGLMYASLLGHSVGARDACLVLCGQLRSGATTVCNVFGRAGDRYIAFVSAGTSHTPLPWGTLRLDPTSLHVIATGQIPAAGAHRLWVPIPPGVSPGVPVFAQAIVTDASLQRIELTNLAQITSS